MNRATDRTARTAAVLLLALVAVPATLSACASTPSQPDPSSTTASSTSWTAAMGSCLRDAGHDVADSDLVEGVIAAPDGVEPEAYMADFDACSAALPESLGGGDHRPSEQDVAEAQESGLKVAQCVRDAGFTDFADPVDGQFPFMSTEETPESRAFFDCDAKYGPWAGEGAPRG